MAEDIPRDDEETRWSGDEQEEGPSVWAGSGDKEEYEKILYKRFDDAADRT